MIVKILCLVLIFLRQPTVILVNGESTGRVNGITGSFWKKLKKMLYKNKEFLRDNSIANQCENFFPSILKIISLKRNYFLHRKPLRNEMHTSNQFF